MLAGLACRSSAWMRPPSQPSVGPGGKDYDHRTILAGRFGHGDDECWVFTPDNPRPTEVPVVVFVHGWSAVDPYLYGGWIGHLVRRGNIVIYPRYQRNLRTRLDEMTPNALRAVQSALGRLEQDGPVRPDTQRFALVGHSMGGFIAANLAAMAAREGLPPPRALMVVEPGDGDGRMPRLGKRLPLADASDLPSDMLFLMVTGDADTVVGDRGAQKIWKGFQAVSDSRKSFVTVASDRRTRPKLIADHFSPLSVDRSFPERPSKVDQSDAGGIAGLWARLRDAQRQRMRHRAHIRWSWRFPPDALDFLGYWKLFDQLMENAFSDPPPRDQSSSVPDRSVCRPIASVQDHGGRHRYLLHR